MHKKTIMFLAIFVFFTNCTNTPMKHQETMDITAEYTNALRLMGKKDFGNAAIIFKRIVEYDHSFYDALPDLVNVYKEIDRLDELIPYFEELAVNGDTYAQWALGLVYDAKKDYEKATAHCKQIITLVPEFPSVYKSLVDIYLTMKTGNPVVITEIEIYLKKLSEGMPPNASVLYGLGYLYQKLYKHEDGLAVINKAIALNPNFYEAYYIKGNIYNNMGYAKQALEVWETGLTLLQQASKAKMKYQRNFLNVIGIAYNSMAEYPKALEYYEKALSINIEIGDKYGEASNLVNLGLAHYNLSDYTIALEYYKKSLSIAKEIGEKYGEGIILNNIGLVNKESTYPLYSSAHHI